VNDGAAVAGDLDDRRCAWRDGGGAILRHGSWKGRRAPGAWLSGGRGLVAATPTIAALPDIPPLARAASNAACWSFVTHMRVPSDLLAHSWSLTVTVPTSRVVTVMWAETKLSAKPATIAYQNKAKIYCLLFKTVAETLTTIAADPKHLGAQIGSKRRQHRKSSQPYRGRMLKGLSPRSFLVRADRALAAFSEWWRLRDVRRVATAGDRNDRAAKCLELGRS
jgi:hypothetical protein